MWGFFLFGSCMITLFRMKSFSSAQRRLALLWRAEGFTWLRHPGFRLSRPPIWTKIAEQWSNRAPTDQRCCSSSELGGVSQLATLWAIWSLYRLIAFSRWYVNRFRASPWPSSTMNLIMSVRSFLQLLWRVSSIDPSESESSWLWSITRRSFVPCYPSSCHRLTLKCLTGFTSVSQLRLCVQW